jgi:hypothetical protein
MICKNIVSNFKWIRNEYKIKYIWWNPITKVIEFHGNSENTLKALQYVRDLCEEIERNNTINDVIEEITSKISTVD